MWSIFSTIILYNFLLLICITLGSLYNKTKERSWIFIMYFIVALISFIRYDIGNDYYNYASGVIRYGKLQEQGFGLIELMLFFGKEPLYILLSRLFSFSDYSYIWVLGIYSVTTIVLLYKVFERYRIQQWGLSVVILFLFLFDIWDWLAQGLALAILIFSIKYVETNNFKKFLLSILIAASVHFSALIFIVVYPLKHLRFRKWFLIVPVVLLFMQMTGALAGLIKYLTSITPFYSTLYSNSIYAEDSGLFSIGYIFRSGFLFFVLYFAKNNFNLLRNIILIGLCFFIIGGTNLSFNRISLYFTFGSVILISNILQERPKTIKTLLGYAFIILQYIVFNINISSFGDARGAVPYQTIFSKECKHMIFRDKLY